MLLETPLFLFVFFYLFGHNDRCEACPVLHKRGACHRLHIQAGRVGEVDIFTITPAHDQQMAAGPALGRKAHDDGVPFGGNANYVIQRGIFQPVCIEAKLGNRAINTNGFDQSQIGRDLVNGRLDFEYVGDTILMPI